jgi:hypothetical protein
MLSLLCVILVHSKVLGGCFVAYKDLLMDFRMTIQFKSPSINSSPRSKNQNVQRAMIGGTLFSPVMLWLLGKDCYQNNDNTEHNQDHRGTFLQYSKNSVPIFDDTVNLTMMKAIRLQKVFLPPKPIESLFGKCENAGGVLQITQKKTHKQPSYVSNCCYCSLPCHQISPTKFPHSRAMVTSRVYS